MESQYIKNLTGCKLNLCLYKTLKKIKAAPGIGLSPAAPN
jgi:hypothetical protein